MLGGEGEVANILGDYSSDAIDDGCRIIPGTPTVSNGCPVENRVSPLWVVRSCFYGDGRASSRVGGCPARLLPCAVPRVSSGSCVRSVPRVGVVFVLSSVFKLRRRAGCRTVVRPVRGRLRAVPGLAPGGNLCCS